MNQMSTPFLKKISKKLRIPLECGRYIAKQGMKWYIRLVFAGVSLRV